MSFETIGEVLRRVAQYHCKASDYYSTLSSSLTDERNNMILRQLATQQREQAQHLQAYLKSAAAGTLATELQFSPAKQLWEAPDVVDAATTNVEDITRLMVGIDNTVVFAVEERAVAAQAGGVIPAFGGTTGGHRQNALVRCAGTSGFVITTTR